MKRGCTRHVWLVGMTLSMAAPVRAQESAPGKALNSPDCIRVTEDRGEQPGDEVLGVGRNGEFCAYPVRMMAHHRIVNDHLGGPPILVVYDPDSGLGAVYDPVLAGKELNFDAAGMSHGYPVVKDRQTGSLWNSVTGEAVQGPQTGKRLARIPCWMITWSAWQTLHGDSWVLKEDSSQSVHYVVHCTPAICAIPAAIRESDMRPDNRLPHESLVLGVATEKTITAVPIASLERSGAVNANVGGDRTVFLFDSAGQAAGAYRPTVRGQSLTFRAAGKGRLVDNQTHSSWNIEGRAIDGPLKGSALAPVEFARLRWYAWSAAHPGTSIHR